MCVWFVWQSTRHCCLYSTDDVLNEGLHVCDKHPETIHPQLSRQPIHLWRHQRHVPGRCATVFSLRQSVDGRIQFYSGLSSEACFVLGLFHQHPAALFSRWGFLVCHVTYHVSYYQTHLTSESFSLWMSIVLFANILVEVYNMDVLPKYHVLKQNGT